MKICQLLHRAIHKNEEEFIKDVYRQLLNREAEDEDVINLGYLLQAGTPRINMIIGILCSDEALELYAKPYVWTSERLPTVADKLQRLLVLGDADLVHHLYVEILGRFPESWGFQQFMQLLQEGHPRISMVSTILQSDEFIQLMQADRYYFTRRILKHFFSTL